jgi:SMC interacting uncharacterized protein involved in chromosome segregation
MEKYKKQVVENMLRNYTSLYQLQDAEFLTAKLDLDKGLKQLNKMSKNLHDSIIGVFILGNTIHEQAAVQNVSKRQTLRRLDDGVHMLTMIMNGDV